MEKAYIHRQTLDKHMHRHIIKNNLLFITKREKGACFKTLW